MSDRSLIVLVLPLLILAGCEEPSTPSALRNVRWTDVMVCDLSGTSCVYGARVLEEPSPYGFVVLATGCGGSTGGVDGGGEPLELVGWAELRSDRGRPVWLEYRIGPAVPGAEALAIDGRPVDLAAGRLFLLDPSGPTVRFKQLAAELPDAPADGRSDAARAEVRSMIAGLRSTFPEIDAFLGPSRSD